MKTIRIAMVAAFLALGVAAAGAQNLVTDEDKAACRPDVDRLCSDYIPDRDRIVACLNKNFRKLGRPCHAVILRARRHSR